ncbi:HD-GYP domain-containing protein, partial [bacterium]
ASDYITKPFSMDYLDNVVVNKVSAQTIEHQRKTIIQIVYALASALEAKDNYTGGHSESVVNYTTIISEELKNKPSWEWLVNKIDFMKNLALLHDIGKMGIQDKILNKVNNLNGEETEEIKKHPSVGANIVSVIDDLADYAPGILYHHEKWNGSGYPEGIKEENIPQEARILAVADAYDAMTTNRPYRKALSKEIAIKRLIDNKNIQFDPIVVDALITALKKQK